ncbi:hypothetical protein PEX2_066600 [Penicillium expansum]|uniref:BTB domain-containing protein n=1 Tax=Penicillium expansum TaxID=27334 RepID=A0A0A2K171_PENEN|nr:hypothetical protein PEX2_066600 [Penicillium expansum]KGO46310.1 hypothetical protein PEXP_099220 [Penicillium expansum]KGO58150.1 hypothetical protein PEX2_066600 [Penicillium expansum]
MKVPLIPEALLEPVVAEEPAAEEPAAKPLDESCFYIQVSAKHLIFASSVFKRILTGGWKESITYLQKGSVEVTAESWDIEALLILLRAIHGKYYEIPRKLTLEMLAKVAVIADYYECNEALYIMKDIWINNLEENIPATYSRDLVLWLWVSWFFQLPSQFEATTSTVMSLSENVIHAWGLPISDKVIGLMNKRREEAINNLVILLHQTREAFISRSRGCNFECSSMMYGALTIQMQSSDLLSPKPEAPFPNLNYKYLTQNVLSFTSPRWSVPPIEHFRGYATTYTHECSNSSFTSLFADLKDYIGGLELNSIDSF